MKEHPNICKECPECVFRFKCVEDDAEFCILDRPIDPNSVLGKVMKIAFDDLSTD